MKKRRLVVPTIVVGIVYFVREGEIMELREEVMKVLSVRSTTLRSVYGSLVPAFPSLTKEAVRVTINSLISEKRITSYPAKGGRMFVLQKEKIYPTVTSLPEMSLKEFQILHFFYTSPSHKVLGRPVQFIVENFYLEERKVRYFLERCVKAGVLMKSTGLIALYLCNTKEYEKIQSLLSHQLQEFVAGVDTKVL